MFQPLEKEINIRFKNKDLLHTVFTHCSFVNENKKKHLEHNERLEFLGDAVLELIMTKYLFDKYPLSSEGELTVIRSALVRKENLAKMARTLYLGKYLKLSHGEEKSGGREKDYILANTYEALIGSIYLDQGLKKCEQFIKQNLVPSLKNILEENLHIDQKSAFQEYTQEKVKITPTYRLIEENGPDHDKIFTMGVYIENKLIAKGTGNSKRKAEEAAAQKALKKLQKESFQ